jgi:hypothetical protein
MKSPVKISTGLLIAIIVLGIVITMSTCLSSQKVVAYNSFPNYTMLKDTEGFRPVHYATYPNDGTIDIKDRNLIESTSSLPTAQRVKNVQGLFGPQDLTSKLDTFSEAKGSLDEQCALTSNGMSNSKGYLCLDANQLELLKTRGGNQTACNKATSCPKCS